MLCPVSAALCAALKYSALAPLQRIFSFDFKDKEDLLRFSAVTQAYLLSHLGRGFDSLNFYYAMREATSPAEGKTT